MSSTVAWVGGTDRKSSSHSPHSNPSSEFWSPFHTHIHLHTGQHPQGSQVGFIDFSSTFLFIPNIYHMKTELWHSLWRTLFSLGLKALVFIPPSHFGPPSPGSQGTFFETLQTLGHDTVWKTWKPLRFQRHLEKIKAFTTSVEAESILWGPCD